MQDAVLIALIMKATGVSRHIHIDSDPSVPFSAVLYYFPREWRNGTGCNFIYDRSVLSVSFRCRFRDIIVKNEEVDIDDECGTNTFQLMAMY